MKILPLVLGLIIFATIGAPLLSAERLEFASPFKGSPRYDLLLWVAETNGYWKEKGLEVEWVPFRGSSLMVRAIAAEKVFIGVSDVATMVQAASRATPVIIVADLKCPQYFLMWVRGDSPIKGPRDLIGKKIGIAGFGGPSHAFARLITKNFGIEPQVRLVGLGGFRERVAALKTGAIDAFMQTASPVANLVATGELRELASAKEFLPKEFVDYVLFSQKEFARTKGETVRKVVAAMLKAADFIMKETAWTRERLVSQFGYSAQGVQLALSDLNFNGAGTPIEPAAMQSTINFFVEYGIIPKDKVPKIQELYTNEFLR